MYSSESLYRKIDEAADELNKEHRRLILKIREKIKGKSMKERNEILNNMLKRGEFDKLIRKIDKKHKLKAMKRKKKLIKRKSKEMKRKQVLSKIKKAIKEGRVIYI